MKVLIVHNAYQSKQIGGEDVVVTKEINGLSAMLGKDQVFKYVVSNDDIHLKKLAFGIWGSQQHAANIKKLVLQYQIDIVHVHNFFPLLTPSVFKAAKKAGAVVIHTLHNYRWWCPSGILYRNVVGHCEKCVHKTWAWPAVIHRCYRGSRLQSMVASLAFAWYRQRHYQQYIDAYFVLTVSQQEKVKSFIPSHKTYLKPNFVDMPESEHVGVLKQNYLFVGRLEAAKGLYSLPETWMTLPAHFHLDVIGSDEENNLLKKKFAKPNIKFWGKLPREEVLTHMRNAKYFIHTSLMVETFGLTLVEALSVGTPVIAFDIGTRKAFIQHGQNGFLCKEEQLKETLLQADSFSNYEQLCQNAMESAKPFYAKAILTKQCELYSKIKQGCET